MTDQTDSQLLKAYVERRLETAFTELARRHVDFVYSAAIRMVRDPHLAEDVTQGVFVALARQAPELAERATLAGWLHRTAQNIAAQTVRTIERRHAREQEAVAMNELISCAPEASWEQIEPHLDAALGDLADPDRDAVLLRYYEKKTAAEMADLLGITDEAAQKRVSRAVERLREFFAKRGVTVGAGGLAIVISANAVQAAPMGLALTISTAAALTGTTLATTATVTATKAIAMTALQKTIVTATIAILAAAGIYEARQAAQLRDQVQTLQQQQAPLAEQIQQWQKNFDSATNGLADLLVENFRLKSNQNELLKLRGEVGLLRKQLETSRDSLAKVTNSALWQPLDLSQFQDSEIVIKRAATTNAGLATPAALLQTWLWALRTKNAEGLEMVFHCQPEEEADKQQLIQGISQSEDKPSGFDNYSLITLLPIEGDSYIALIAEESQAISLPRRMRVMKQVFRRIGNEWKLPVSHVGHSFMQKIPN